MPPTLVGAGTAAYSATSSAAIVPGLPTGWAAGDIAVLWYHRSSNTDLATPSGWTEILAANQNNTAAMRVEVFVRRLVGGDSAPSLPGPADTTVRGARIVAVRGCPTTGTADSHIVASSRSNNTTGPTVTFATITPGVDDTLLVALEAYEDDPTARTTPSGWSAPVISTSNLGNDLALVYMERTWPTGATPTGSITYTASGGSFAGPNTGILLAFQGVALNQLVGGRARGAGAAAATLRRGLGLVGRASGRGQAAATGRAARGLVGRASGAATTLATLTATPPAGLAIALVGAATGRGGAVGALTVTPPAGPTLPVWPIRGRDEAMATSFLVPVVIGALVGRARGSGSAAGHLTVARALAGQARGRTAAAARPAVARSVAGRAGGAARAAGDLTATPSAGQAVALAGVSGGAARATARLTRGVVLVGASGGRSTARAVARLALRLAGRTHGQARVRAGAFDLAGQVALAGRAAAGATARAAIWLAVRLTGRGAGTATATGQLTLRVTPTTVIRPVRSTSTITTRAESLSALVVVASTSVVVATPDSHAETAQAPTSSSRRGGPASTTTLVS